MAQVSKLDAAERLIVSGINMVERGEDPIAIHVVAASALNMLRELIQEKGDDYTAWVLREGLHLLATARLKGMPINLPTTPEIDALIDDVARGIETGAIKEPTDLKVTLDTEERRRLVAYIIRPFNFLKHAQRDPLATLDEDDVDQEGAIIHALTAYSVLRPGRALPEQVAPFLAKHDLL